MKNTPITTWKVVKTEDEAVKYLKENDLWNSEREAKVLKYKIVRAGDTMVVVDPYSLLDEKQLPGTDKITIP